MSRTFSLESLFLATAIIAGWLALCRAAADLAVVFTLVSVPALMRTFFVASRCAESQIRLSVGDKVSLFLSSESVVIASLVTPIGLFLLAMWPTNFVHRSPGMRHVADAVIATALAVGLSLAVISIVVIIRRVWPIRIVNEAPRRRLALAAGLPVAFFVGWSQMLYGAQPFVTALFGGRPALLPSLIGLFIALPASVYALAAMAERRQVGRPGGNAHVLLTLLRAATWMAGTALASAGCGLAVFWAFSRLPGALFSSVLGPATSLSSAAMTAIALTQRLFATLGMSEPNQPRIT